MYGRMIFSLTEKSLQNVFCLSDCLNWTTFPRNSRLLVMRSWGGVCWAVVQECDTSYAAGSDHGVFKPVYSCLISCTNALSSADLCAPTKKYLHKFSIACVIVCAVSRQCAHIEAEHLCNYGCIKLLVTDASGKTRNLGIRPCVLESDASPIPVYTLSQAQDMALFIRISFRFRQVHSIPVFKASHSCPSKTLMQTGSGCSYCIRRSFRGFRELCLRHHELSAGASFDPAVLKRCRDGG